MSELTSFKETNSSFASILKTPKHFRGYSELTFEEKIRQDVQTLPYLNLKAPRPTWDSLSTAILKKQLPSPESQYQFKISLPKPKLTLQVRKGKKKCLSFNLDHFSHCTKFRQKKPAGLRAPVSFAPASSNFHYKLLRRRSCNCNGCGTLTSKQNAKLYLAPFYPNKALQLYSSKSIANMYQTARFSNLVRVKSRVSLEKKEGLSNSLKRINYEIRLWRANSWQEGVAQKTCQEVVVGPLSESLNSKIDAILNNPMATVIGIRVDVQKRESDRISCLNLRSTFSFIYTPARPERSQLLSRESNVPHSQKKMNCQFVLLKARHLHEANLKKNAIFKYIQQKQFKLPITTINSPIRQLLTTSRDSMRSQFRSSGTITPRLEEIYLEKDRCLKTRNITKRPLITEFQRKIFDVSSVKKKFHPYITKK